ncbi:MAG: hypothetical protein ABSH16_04700 [Sedimentisphaerales bacterium]
MGGIDSELFRKECRGALKSKFFPYPLSYQAPLQIPDPLKKWPESTGIGGRFEPEWVSGLKRNHCPLSTGIYKVGEDRIITSLPNKSEAMTAKTSHMMKDEER